MKTKHIAMSLLAASAFMLSACQNEEINTDIEITEGVSAFKVKAVATRSEAVANSSEIASITTPDGQTFVLGETVTSLDEVYSSAPETRGTPAFTQNVAALYQTFNAVAQLSNGNQAFAQTADATYKYNESNDMWEHSYGEDIWGQVGNEYTKLPTWFFMRMPASADGVTNGAAGLTYERVSNETVPQGKIKFNYTTPATAAAQKDILFTTKYRTEAKNGEEIIFYHALTGIKFANFFDYSLNEGAYAKAETIIKEVKISGLNNTGHCTITPAAPNSGKKSSEVVVWDSVEGSGTYTQAIDHDFAVYDKNLFPDGTLDPNASKNNLNKDDGSLTFFFIPQTLTKDVTFEIKFDVSLKTLDGTTVTSTEKTFSDVVLTVKLADVLDAKHLTWKAGELHTYTLWPRAIGVKISDKMNEAKDKKSDVVVKNTGNTWQYVRVNLVGNWVGKVTKDAAGTTSNPTILMGYSNATIKEGTSATAVPPQYANETETQPWNDKDGYTNYGKFVNLTPKSDVIPAAADHTVNNWVRYDKYYYYTKAIGPNDAITNPLFESYTVYTSPEFWIPDLMGVRRLAQDVHLEMDLMVEAIEAPTDATGKLVYPDGTLIGDATDGYIKAWVKALGLERDSDLLDLK